MVSSMPSTAWQVIHGRSRPHTMPGAHPPGRDVVRPFRWAESLPPHLVWRVSGAFVSPFLAGENIAPAPSNPSIWKRPAYGHIP